MRLPCFSALKRHALANEGDAAGIRTLAQYAIDNGSDVITQEHFDAEFEAPE